MTQEVKTLIGIGVVTLLILIGGVFLLTKNSGGGTGSSGSIKGSDNLTVYDSKILSKDDNYKIGTDSAKVKIVEFGDYQCPACGQAYPIVKRITQDYSGKIEFVFRNYPLPQHANAQISAEAAEASGAQGKYWEMHDKLYENQNQWSNETKPLDIFLGYAQGLGLNVDQFKADVTNNKYSNKIQNDQNDGNSTGLNATPTFFINGLRYTGVLSYDDFKSVIDSTLSSR